MEKRDYVTLAAAFHASQPDQDADPAGYNGWYEAFSAVADALEAERPEFDRLRFAYAAAGGTVPAAADAGRPVDIEREPDAHCPCGYTGTGRDVQAHVMYAPDSSHRVVVGRRS